MSNAINAIETRFNGYRFRSRLEARWAVFFSAVGLEYEYEMEGYEMDEVKYLPDFYIPSLDRWFQIKGQAMSVKEIQKCEQFCFRKDNENIKFSVLIGTPTPAMYQAENFSIMGINEFIWEWPSDLYPADTRLLAEGLVKVKNQKTQKNLSKCKLWRKCKKRPRNAACIQPPQIAKE